jgi:hypothetical protein
MTIQERIIQYIDLKGITPYRFCKDLGLSQGYLDKRGAIGTDKYLKIIEYYTDISPEWLLTGKGEMLKACISHVEVPSTITVNEIILSLIEKNGNLRQQLGEQINENKHLHDKNISLIEKNNKFRFKFEETERQAKPRAYKTPDYDHSYSLAAEPKTEYKKEK